MSIANAINDSAGREYLFRLARETGVALLPGNGFEVVDTSARVSLANLSEWEYVAIGRLTRKVLDEYFDQYQSTYGQEATASFQEQ